MGERLRTYVLEFIRFGAAGAFALLIEIAIFTAAVAAGASPLVANPITMGLRIGVAFFLTRELVFASREKRPAIVEFGLFMALALANILVVEAFLYLAMAASGGSLGPLAAAAVKVVAICVTLVGRYFISRRYVFRATSAMPDTQRTKA